MISIKSPFRHTCMTTNHYLNQCVFVTLLNNNTNIGEDSALCMSEHNMTSLLTRGCNKYIREIPPTP